MLIILSVVVLDLYERLHVKQWRETALQKCYDHICADDEFTKCISIGPVSKKISIYLYTINCFIKCNPCLMMCRRKELVNTI